MSAQSADQFGDAMLALADRLFEEFDKVPVLTVIRALNTSREELGGGPIPVHLVESRAKEILRSAGPGPGNRVREAGGWLMPAVLFASALLGGPGMDLAGT